MYRTSQIVSATRLIVLSTALALSAVPALIAAPQAVVPETVVDVGKVAKGEAIRRTFTVENQGDAVLTVRDVKSSCGCAVAKFDKTIAPGERGTIEAVVSTENFTGPIAKAVTVYTSDASNPQFNLVIKAHVQPLIEITPGYARFVVVEGSGRESSKQTLWTPEGPALDVRSVRSPYPFLRVESKRAGEAGRWEIELVLDKDAAAVGPMADFVEVETNHPKQRVLKIPVSGYVRPEVSVIPPIADLGGHKLDEPFVATFEVRNHTAGSITVDSASTNVAGASTSVEELQSGKAYKVTLVLEPGMPAGAFDGTIRISTSSRRRPVVEVPIRGTVL